MVHAEVHGQALLAPAQGPFEILAKIEKAGLEPVGGVQADRARRVVDAPKFVIGADGRGGSSAAGRARPT
jgi:hypothetical protein